MSISYIIATYSGKDHINNKELSPHVLQIQLKQLEQFIKHKKKTLIKEIIVMCPQVPEENQFKNYYLQDHWLTIFSNLDITLQFIIYTGNNKYHSYDQWIQGCNKATGDYFLLIEDDYCLDYTNNTLDIDLITCYHEQFENNIGYLASWAPIDDPYHGYHAAISNGLISKETFNTIKNPLCQFYGIKKSIYPQVNFSHLFLINNIEIKDFRDTFKVLFWNSWENRIEDYSLNKDYKHVFIPVQYVN